MIKTVKKDLILEYIKDSESDQYLIEYLLAGFPKNMDQVSLLEVTAMMLKYVKLEAEKAAKGQVKDVVFVIPNFWNIHQRNFLLQAAEIADMYVLSLITENAGASINFALSQRSTN